MNLNMTIKNIKAIKTFQISLPVEQGLYAITGENGSGKSTVVMCGAAAFFQFPMHEYFGKTDEGASIEFELNGATRRWETDGKKWNNKYHGKMNIKGFYEGSLIFGNRFRNTSINSLKSIEKITEDSLIEGDEYIRSNMGSILHNDSGYYEKLYKVNPTKMRELQLRGEIFFYKKRDKLVSQLHMSTGENLLVSVLHSLNIRNSERATTNKPCVFFLDEIELALHPASLKRLLPFLKKQTERYNYAIYFSTHSIELISEILPENIFYLQRHFDDSIEIVNPCYPSYATKILYDHSGYDTVILVEDDLAKELISRIIKNNNMVKNSLVHVLPCGGWTNVIDLANEAVNSNLLGKTSKIVIMLDLDINERVQPYIESKKHSFNIPLNFLPVESLEKYLKMYLFDRVDHNLYRLLDNYIFNQKSLSEILKEYQTKKLYEKDNNGKELFDLLNQELRKRNKSRSELVEIIVKYLIDTDATKVDKVVNFLMKHL